MVKPEAPVTEVPQPRIAPYGDCAVYLSYPAKGYDAGVNAAVLEIAARLRASGEWEDVVSGYDSLVASFNPVKMSLNTAGKRLEAALGQRPKTARRTSAKTIDVPVYYGGENGPDMNAIIASSGLSKTDIIKAHSAAPYTVSMMGFVPGFTFLSEAPQALHHPRHSEPRLSVPAGSIGIAGWQTGIYGLSSPGGWQIIGRTPLTLFDASREAPFLWKAGDSLRFVPQFGIFPETVQEGVFA